jgi:hypothetical protein
LGAKIRIVPREKGKEVERREQKKKFEGKLQESECFFEK